ncbi:MAG TPA: AMP-binding protein, partial [Euzebya sp.]|nr:AMP-binding protein [Euzebya sp.]
RTVAPKAYADGLLLPGPPRHHDGAAAPAAQAPAADEDQPAAMSLATVDIDVRPALHDADTDEHTEQPPAADPHAPAADEADGHAVGVSDRPAEVEPDDRRVVEDAADVVGAEPAPEAEAGSPWAPSTELADAVAQPEIPDAVGHEDVAASGAEVQTVELTAGVGPVATDRPWVRAYPPGVPDTYRYPLVPVTRFLDDAAQDFPDITAVRFLGTDLSFRQLSEQVDRLATAILDLGLTAGDRIAVALPWSPQLVIVLHAAWRSGIEAVVLDPDAAPEQLADAMALASPAMLVVLDTLYPSLGARRDQLGAVRHVIASGLLDSLPALRARVQAVRLKVPTVQIPQADGVLAFRGVMDGGAPTATQADVDVETTPAVSLAKDGRLVSLTHCKLLAGAFKARLWIPDMRAGREAVAVAGSPADPFTLGAGLALAMLAAGTLVLPEPRPGGVARAIDDARPTVFIAPIEQVRRVLAPASKRRDLSSIRVTVASGVAPDATVRRAMEQRTGGRLRVALSAPDVAGMAVAQPVYADAKDGSAGLPVSDCDIRVRDQDWVGVGELEVRGPQVAGEDWVGLGLVGGVDDLGDVTVVGPLGRVVRHAGGATDPDVLVAALRRHDGVADATVHTEPSGTGLRLVVQVTVTDASLTEAQLVTALTQAAPSQALPERWLLTAPQPPTSDEPLSVANLLPEPELTDDPLVTDEPPVTEPSPPVPEVADAASAEPPEGDDVEGDDEGHA